MQRRQQLQLEHVRLLFSAVPDPAHLRLDDPALGSIPPQLGPQRAVLGPLQQQEVLPPAAILDIEPIRPPLGRVAANGEQPCKLFPVHPDPAVAFGDFYDPISHGNHSVTSFQSSGACSGL